VETVEQLLGLTHHVWALREGSQEEESFMKANERLGVGEAGRAEQVQGFQDAGSFA
jgi:hypothetical protein